jgi:hypothetical protein
MDAWFRLSGMDEFGLEVLVTCGHEWILLDPALYSESLVFSRSFQQSIKHFQGWVEYLATRRPRLH